jgi:hypothetical protein
LAKEERNENGTELCFYSAEQRFVLGALDN